MGSDEEEEFIPANKMSAYSVFMGWAYYKMNSMLAMRSNQFKLLVFCVLLTVVVAAVPFYAVGCVYGERLGDTPYLECLWDVYALVSDTGIQYYALHSYNRAIGAVVTFMGLMFAATLTGFVVDAVMEKMNDLRKGKSAVKEWDHTLLIGWTDRSIAFISQICLANESSGGGTIVVLSNRGKEEMEAELNSTLSDEDLMGTEVVFRSGSPLNAMDLRRAACETARSIVIMATGDTHSAADAATLRVVIALKTFPELLGHVVVEVLDKEMEYLMKIVGGTQIETLITFETLARMSLTAVKQPGIALVYEQLLGFDGDEFYTASWPNLAGKPFSACVEYFPAAVAIGVVAADGSVILLPDNDYPMSADTGIIVVAEDDDAYEALEYPFQIDVGELPERKIDADAPERLLFVGWTDNVKGMLEILNSIFDPGTEVHLLNRCPLEERVERLAEMGLDCDRDLANLEVTHIVGNPALWRTLRGLDLASYRCMLVISDELEAGNLMASDSHNLACILLLRNHIELRASESARLNGDKKKATPSVKASKDTTAAAKTKASGKSASALTKKPKVGSSTPEQPIFCEVLDTRTQKLIASHPTLGKNCQFLVSNRLISKIMAMVAEDRKVVAILNILLSDETGMDLKPSELYVGAFERVSFFVVAKRAQALSHIVLGYQTKSNLEDLYINPKDKDVPKYWTDVDFIVVCKGEAVARSKARNGRDGGGGGGLGAKDGSQSALEDGAKGIVRHSGERRTSSNCSHEDGSSGGGGSRRDSKSHRIDVGEPTRNGRVGSHEAPSTSALHGAYPAGGPPGGPEASLGQSLLEQKRGSIGKRTSMEGHQAPSLEKEPMEKVLALVAGGLAEAHAKSLDAKQMAVYAQVDVPFYANASMGFTLGSDDDQTNNHHSSDSAASPGGGAAAANGRFNASSWSSSSSSRASNGLAVHPLVVAVADQSQAQDAGVSVGWRVLSVAGTTVTSASEVQTAVRTSQAAGKRTVLVSFWVPPEVENPEVAKRESTLDLLGASAATMLHGITGGLDAALKLKVDSMEDSVAREVALRLKVAAYEARYGSEGSNTSSHMHNSSSIRLIDKSSNQSASLGLMSHHGPQSPFASNGGNYRGAGGGGFAPGGQEVLNDNMEGYRHQVTELQKHLEQERQLRRVTARMLKETQEAVSSTAAAQEAQQKVLAEAAALQQEQAQAIERQRQEVETLLAQQNEHQSSQQSRVYFQQAAHSSSGNQQEQQQGRGPNQQSTARQSPPRQQPQSQWSSGYGGSGGSGSGGRDRRSVSMQR